MSIFLRLFGGDDEKRPTTTAELLPKARDQHYALAHITLRQASLQMPLIAYDQLSSRKYGIGTLAKLFDEMSANLRKAGKPTPIANPKFKLHPIKEGDFYFVVVEMPVARAPAEAHMTALAMKQSDVDARSIAALGRYFTLELGTVMGKDTLRTVLCEWQGARHVNFGDGPPVDPTAFVHAIGKVLSTPPSA